MYSTTPRASSSDIPFLTKYSADTGEGTDGTTMTPALMKYSPQGYPQAFQISIMYDIVASKGIAGVNILLCVTTGKIARARDRA